MHIGAPPFIPVPKPGWRGLQDDGDFGFLLNKLTLIFGYINGPHRQYIKVDTVFNYICYFGRHLDFLHYMAVWMDSTHGMCSYGHLTISKK